MVTVGGFLWKIRNPFLSICPYDTMVNGFSFSKMAASWHGAQGIVAKILLGFPKDCSG